MNSSFPHFDLESFIYLLASQFEKITEFCLTYFPHVNFDYLFEFTICYLTRFPTRLQQESIIVFEGYSI